MVNTVSLCLCVLFYIEYYAAFNGSFSSFSQIFHEVSDAKERIELLRDDMVKGRRLMESRSQDLLTLYLQNIKYKEMIRILDNMYAVVFTV